MPLAGWVADAEAGHREHPVRQRQLARDGVHLVANDDDGAAAEPNGLGGRMNVCRASAASIVALKNASRSPLRTGWPRILPMRSRRRASPQNTRNAGEFPIHGMSGNSLPIFCRLVESLSLMIETCWKSDLDEADSATASRKLISSSETGCAV